jgi:hypothetical protein
VSAATAELPWRGPGPGRPDLPLPPGEMPLVRGGMLRKRWRYVGVYSERVMLVAARVQIGPLRQAFWAVWDRERRRRLAHTGFLRGAGEVVFDGLVLRLEARDARAELRLGESSAIESLCPSGRRGYGWTRKRAAVPVSGWIEAAGRRFGVDSLAVEDVSAGYHQRHTRWRWSAGVGTGADGRTLGWNLVTGINDPPRGSERAIWVDGEPSEPQPVSFRGLEAIEFADGSSLAFSAESERTRSDNLLLIRSRYRHLFGSFAGALPGVELASGLGVMEEHDAHW